MHEDSTRCVVLSENLAAALWIWRRCDAFLPLEERHGTGAGDIIGPGVRGRHGGLLGAGLLLQYC